MNEFYITPKQAPSSASKAASGVASRMSEGSGRSSAKSSKSANMASSRGHFAAAAMRIAKKRSGTNPPAFLQHGVPKNAPQGAMNIGETGIDQPGKPNRPAQATEGQTALNPKQQGASSKNAQRGRGKGES